MFFFVVITHVSQTPKYLYRVFRVKELHKSPASSSPRTLVDKHASPDCKKKEQALFDPHHIQLSSTPKVKVGQSPRRMALDLSQVLKEGETPIRGHKLTTHNRLRSQRVAFSKQELSPLPAPHSSDKVRPLAAHKHVSDEVGDELLKDSAECEQPKLLNDCTPEPRSPSNQYTALHKSQVSGINKHQQYGERTPELVYPSHHSAVSRECTSGRTSASSHNGSLVSGVAQNNEEVQSKHRHYQECQPGCHDNQELPSGSSGDRRRSVTPVLPCSNSM